MAALKVVRPVDVKRHVIINHAVFAEQGKPIVIIVPGERVLKPCLSVGEHAA
jgi:hypothetical protein